MKIDIIKYEVTKIISNQLNRDISYITQDTLLMELCLNEDNLKKVISNIEKIFEINLSHNLESFKTIDLNGLSREIDTAINNKPLYKHFF